MKENLNLIILSGGKSSRMGTKKQFLKFGDDTFLATLVKKGVFLKVNKILISGDSPYENCQNVLDTYSEIGPIGGIYSSLKASDCEDNLILAVDTPQIPTDLLQKLIDEYFKAKKTGASCIFLSANGYKEPLISVLNKSVLPSLETAIKNQKYSVLRALNQLNIAEYLYTGDMKDITGFNTIEEYNALADRL